MTDMWPPESTGEIDPERSPGLHKAFGLLGKNVKIRLTDLGREPVEIAKGKLLSFCDGGEAAIQDEMGFTHWCWPMLDIEEDL